MSDLGKRIQELRKQAGLTQAQLAEKIDISHTQLTRYESKGVLPPADVLERLANIFDTSIDCFGKRDHVNFCSWRENYWPDVTVWIYKFGTYRWIIYARTDVYCCST